jgi:hypothetical protein
MSIIISFALLAGLYAILFRVYEVTCVNIVIPVAKTKHELYHFARQVGKEAAQEGRKEMNANDRNQIVSFAGVKSWQDLDVVIVHAHFKEGNNG